MKGAIKEGTDMDAFSSTEPVNDCSPETPPQIQQAIQEPPPQPTPALQTPPPKAPENVAPVIEPTPPATMPNKPADVKTIIKNKVDVTSIVKEVPKKPFIPPPPQTTTPTTESQDETDRAVNEKLVQVKNEANIKANAADTNDNNQVIDKNVIRYKKGKLYFKLFN